MNRRHFLATTAAAGLALGVQAAPPERKWRVAVLGDSARGKYGHAIDTMWQHLPETEIVAVADSQPKGLEAALKKLNIAQGFADYHDIGQARPDIVAIAPAMGLHRDMALAAVAAGARGIYMEKPFCRTLTEADEIIAACEKGGVKLALAHRNRQHPALPVVKQMVKDGAIGRVLELRGRGKEDRRGGLEDLWILGSHVVDLAVYLAGKPTACSGTVFQDGRPVVPADVVHTREEYGAFAGNQIHARFDMESGVPLYFDSFKEAGDLSANFGVQIIGTTGLIDVRVDRTPLAHLVPGNPTKPTKEARPWIPITSAGTGQPEPNASVEHSVMSHLRGARDLIAAIEEDRQPLCSMYDGRSTVEMITAVLASHVRNGERVTFPLSTTGNPFQNWR